MLFFKRKGKSEEDIVQRAVKETIPDISNLVSSCEQQLRELDDILYGIALYFECISLLHADQPTVIETYRKQLRNIIQRGKELASEASELLTRINKDPRTREALKGIRLNLAEEIPESEPIIKRAKLLVQLYEKYFPGRPRSQEFTEDELFTLMEASADKFDEL